MRIIRLVVLSVAFLVGVTLAHGFSAGELDIGFDPGSGANAPINAIAIQADGKMIIGGEFTEIDGIQVNRIARLLANGAVDDSFDVGTGIDGSITDIALQDDGKIIVGGNFTMVNGVSQYDMARLNTDGSLDVSFNSIFGEGGAVNVIALQDDGKIIVGGFFYSIGYPPGDYIVRLNSNGQLDNSFSIGSANAGVLEVALQKNGKMILGGQFTQFNGISYNRIIRLNSNGTIDNEFTSSGSNSDVLSIEFSEYEKIIVGGGFTDFNNATKNSIARLDNNGDLDSEFIGDCPDCAIQSILIQKDGKIIIGGYFGLFEDSDDAYYLSRLSNDGTLDNGFYQGIDSSFSSQSIFDMALQQDGKIIVVGDFLGYRSISRNKIARIHTGDPDGDGIEDAADYFPADPLEWLDTDSDAIGNNADWDDDGDGVPDVVDAAPLDNGNTSEITLPLNAVYKGSVLKQNAVAQ